MKKRILIVEDEEMVRNRFVKVLSRAGYDVREARNLAEAQDAITEQAFDGVLLDHELPDGHGIDWIESCRKQHTEMAIIMITAYADIPLAVEAMQKGADNFLTKPVDMADLKVYLEKSLEVGALRRKVQANERTTQKANEFVGRSPMMKKVMEMATVAAENESPVLLQGESGTGKSFIARWIHAHSARHAEPFVEVNCSVLRGEMLASELFGHVKGAFTSAVQDKKGLIEVADRGSLFLDEIGDMDQALQAQFLKVIEEKNYRRLGDTRLRYSEFRLICATNQDLETMTADGSFREDLFFRLNVFPIHIPPLREMKEDLEGWIEHTLQTQSHTVKLTEAAKDALLKYDWPGNIRELKNVLERASLLARGDDIDKDHLPPLTPGKVQARGSGLTLNLGEQEASSIQSALQRAGGDKSKAAKLLGISRATLYRKLKEIEAG